MIFSYNVSALLNGMENSIRLQGVRVRTSFIVLGTERIEAIHGLFLAMQSRAKAVVAEWSLRCRWRLSWHNSQLISLQAKQNSESVGQRALIGESVANCVSRPPPQKWQLVKGAIDEPREKTCIAKGIGRRLVMAKARRSAGKGLRLNP